MDNTEKLVRALIDALGFDIECCLGKEEVDGLLVKSKLTTNYKLTKKPNPLDVMYDGTRLRRLVENVYQEAEWIRYPEKSFNAVIEWFGDEAIRINEHRYNINGVEVSLDE